MIARLALSAVPFYIDKPYDYLVPEELENKMKPGMRVHVPFARGNKICEGIVLKTCEKSDLTKLKSIIRCLDEEPVLTEDDIRLAYYMRERFFCTFYDAVRAILPPGLWFEQSGKRKVEDKTIPYVKLIIPNEEAELLADTLRRRAPKQSELIDMLCSFEIVRQNDLLLHCATSKSCLNELVKKGVAEIFRRETYRSPVELSDKVIPLPVLNTQQNQQYEKLCANTDSGEFSTALLYGITGSGKTSVYLHLISRELEKGKTALLLVPEISLTPQMIRTISSHFGKEIAVLHSSLSPGERFDEWKRIKRGEAKLVVGTRSAVFAPLKNIGLVIVDEEHDSSYISESSPRYNTIDVAKYICYREKCLLLLASATPDIVSYYNSQNGIYGYFELNSRFNESSLPECRIVDLKKELKNGNNSSISSVLAEEIQRNIDNNEQTLLYVNRRGTHKLVCCGNCGFTYYCPKCSTGLTYHGSNRRLICHYCGYSERYRADCPECGSEMIFSGFGTQQVEDEIKAAFKDIGTIRVDTDTVSRAGSHEALFREFVDKKIPVMVGTQMIVKGHNFDNVTLVGVLSADQGIYSESYKASENVFDSITQVIGRSGRAEKSGRAVIQAFSPDNATIKYAAEQNYKAFYSSEIQARKLSGAPPFNDNISLVCTDIDFNSVMSCLNTLKQMLASYRNSSFIEILGPAPMSVEKINNRYRYRLNVICKNDKQLRADISAAICEVMRDTRYKSCVLYADINSSD